MFSEILKDACFTDSVKRSECEKALEAMKEHWIDHGLWLASLEAERIEAAKGRQSDIAASIMKYRTTRQLKRETGFNVSEEA